MSGGPGWKLLAGVALTAAALTAVGTTIVMRPGDAAIEGDAIRAYLLSHPEVIPEAMAKLRQREAGQQVDANRRAIETPFAGAWAGAADGDVVLVQFYDYACGYCRASLPDIRRLIDEDPKLKVVFRELPILSAESETAARVSLAAAQQGKFVRFHEAMYAAGGPAPGTIAAAQASAGLDAGKVAGTIASPGVDQELQANLALARTLGFTGTPAWVIGDQALAGAVGYAALKTAIAETRAAR